MPFAILSGDVCRGKTFFRCVCLREAEGLPYSAPMIPPDFDSLGLIAGKGSYPLLLADSARRQGIRRLVAVAFKGETDRSIRTLAHEVHWLYVGQLERLLDTLVQSGVRHAVMAGQITPTHLFRTWPDRLMLDLLRRLPKRNAETIFGAVAEELRKRGIELLPASSFMEEHMPPAGLLTRRPPTEAELGDIELGRSVAKATSGLDIGQTVVVKNGTTLAVEAFEGTDEAIRRAGKLGGADSVVVKVAKKGHDMRFDIPVVGLKTIRSLRRARARVLAFEAGRTILLDRDEVLAEANRLGLSILAIDIGDTPPEGDRK